MLGLYAANQHALLTGTHDSQRLVPPSDLQLCGNLYKLYIFKMYRFKIYRFKVYKIEEAPKSSWRLASP